MKHKLIALLTAGMMLASSGAISPVRAEDDSYMDSVIGTLPDWTPMNFIDAMEFYNTYGKTHVEDNFICLVKPIRLDEKDKYRTAISGSMVMINTPASTSPAVFELEIPELPDQNDEEALAEYEELCNKLGVPTDDYTFFEDYANSEAQYAFEVQLFRVLEGHDLTVTWLEKDGVDYRTTETFTFENPSGFIEQTDIYNWLPDCPAEYNWLKSYSHESTLAASGACVYDNYIAYCAEVNASTGASLEMEQSGEGAIEYYMESDCNGFDLRSMVELVDGGGSSSVIVYQPAKDGLVDVEWTVGMAWSDEAPSDTTIGRYEIKDDCSVITDLSKGSTIFTFIDKDSGELIDMPEDAGFTKETIQEDYTSELYAITSNPCVIDSLRAYDPHCSYSFCIRTADGYYDEPEFEITSEEPSRIEVTCKLKYNKDPDLPAAATRIMLYDKDTGELIPSEVVKYHNFRFGTDIRIKNPNLPGGWMSTAPYYVVESNPFIYLDDLANLYRTADEFEFICDDQPKVTLYGNGSMDVVFRIKITVSGNINGDDEFSVNDAVTLQKWLLGEKDVEIFNWAEGDFDLNNRLDAFDLCIMKRKLIEKNNASYVKPEETVEYGAPLRVTADSLKLYLGPDESSQSIAVIPKDTQLYEMGYQKNNQYWLFTEYEGQYGWIRIFAEDNQTPTVVFEVYPDKPVIYLYPEQETDVRVELELTESELSTTYPKYQDGWDVVAYPDGTLLNKADGTHHKYLFWDAKNCRTKFDFSKGFCVAGSDTERFFKEKLTYMGLTEQEMNEFIVYWLPRMEHNAYNLITFQGDAYTDSAKLHITPSPDSICRIFMAYVPLENAVEIAPQQLETFERTGFTVVEWGGCEIKS